MNRSDVKKECNPEEERTMDPEKKYQVAGAKVRMRKVYVCPECGSGWHAKMCAANLER